MLRVCFKQITWYIEMHHVRTPHFLITWCTFTTFLSSRGKLTALSVCHRTISMAAVYRLKTKHDQDKFGAVFLDAFDTISCPLEDEHVVDVHHVIRKCHDATQKNCPHMVHFNVPRNFQTLRRELKIHCMSYKKNTFLPVLFGSLLLAGFCSL